MVLFSAIFQFYKMAWSSTKYLLILENPTIFGQIRIVLQRYNEYSSVNIDKTKPSYFRKRYFVRYEQEFCFDEIPIAFAYNDRKSQIHSEGQCIWPKVWENLQTSVWKIAQFARNKLLESRAREPKNWDLRYPLSVGRYVPDPRGGAVLREGTDGAPAA